VPVKKITEFQRMSQRFLYWRREQAKADAKKVEARDWLKPWVMANAEPDENGNRRLFFEAPYEVDSEPFAGLELRKSQGKSYLDIEAVKAYIKEHGLEDQVIKTRTETYIDTDALVILNQQLIIPDEDLDSLYETPDPTYSLYAIDG
jgi:hypothetical protein